MNLINEKKYIVGNLSDVETFDEFENFVKECESTTKTWSLDLQYAETWEQFFEDGQKNYQNIVIFNKKKEMVALWTFMFDIPAKAVEYSIVVKKEHRSKGLGTRLMVMGERYVKANWGQEAGSIFGRVRYPENQSWIKILTSQLGYHSMEIYEEDGILFFGKQIHSFFTPHWFNQNTGNVIEMDTTYKSNGRWIN